MAALFAGWASDPFAEQVEKATSELLPAGQEDIALNLEICDQVRAKQVPAKHAMQIIKKRLSHKNPNVVLLSLGLTDICIKNGGDHFLAEVASREFMDNLVSILRNPAGVNMDVKSKALGLIQNWAQIAEAKPQQMAYINETYKSLRSSGFDFPPRDTRTAVSAALVETMTAPEWIDGDVCMRCRTSFTTFNRKHHCRNCGNVFCQDCSSKTMALPWFGIGQDVRVCDGCYAKRAPTAKSTKLARSSSATSAIPTGRGGAGSHHRSRTMDSGTKRGSSRASKEEDDLALAIKMSLEAASSSGSRPGFVASQPPAIKEGRPTKQADGRMLEGTDSDDDPDLAAAIAASLRDYTAPAPSAPIGLDDPRAATPRAGEYQYQRESSLPLPPSLELPATDVDALLSFAHNAVGQENYARQHGQWQPAHQQYQTQELYEKATLARPRMAKSLDEATRRHGVLISMHDKLTEAVRLYDRLLDAQLSRPSQYGTAPLYGNLPATAAPPVANYAQQQGYSEGHNLYPSFPQQNQSQYAEADYLHQTGQSIQSPSVPYRVVETPYSEHAGSQYFASRPSFSSFEASRDEYTAHRYNQQQQQQSQYQQQEQQQQQQQRLPQQQPYDEQYQQPSHAKQQVPHQQNQNAVNEQPSAPSAPSTTYTSPQITGKSGVYNNHWQMLESLPSAPSNTTMQVDNAWTQLSPPSQRPAQESLHNNMHSLPPFENLSIEQQQRSFSDSVNGMTSPSQSYRHVSSGKVPRMEDLGQGWSGVPIQKTGTPIASEGYLSNNNNNIKSSAPASSPYSSQPWTRPLETPLIDL